MAKLGKVSAENDAGDAGRGEFGTNGLSWKVIREVHARGGGGEDDFDTGHHLWTAGRG